MCAIENTEPADVWATSWRTARKPWKCVECTRAIPVGERHLFISALMDGRWSTWRTCAHCRTAGKWMDEVCGGYPVGMLREELVEHWEEGFCSIPLGRLVAGQRLRWHDGRDPIPDGDAVQAMAVQMLRKQVAA